MTLKKLFIHIPKNAGCTIRLNKELKNKIIDASPKTHISKAYTASLLDTMNTLGDHHGHAHARWRDFRGDLRANHQAFTIVRNPWARAAFADGSLELPSNHGRFQCTEARIPLELPRPSGT